jgi:hypothetical protein
MGDYFGHWLALGAAAADPDKLPRLYYVNWFRKDASGRYVWPGFGENSRVLKWIVQRLSGEAEAVATRTGRWRRTGCPSSSGGSASICPSGCGSYTRTWSTASARAELVSARWSCSSALRLSGSPALRLSGAPALGLFGRWRLFLRSETRGSLR